MFFLFDPVANSTIAVSAVSAIPEPAESLLLAMGLLAVMGRMRGRRGKSRA